MSISNSIEDLKSALLQIDATGAEGFEGLLAVVLGKISGETFRLAGAGSQFGKDGEAASPFSIISFEGKLYKKKIDKNEVLSKLSEIIASTRPPDVWILGATIEIKTQILEPLAATSEKNGICTLILDWPNAAILPPLAVACAMAANEVGDFLDAHMEEADLVIKAREAVAAIRAHPDFEQAAKRIIDAVRNPAIGSPIALAANQCWLAEAFSDRRRAKEVFGQMLAPAAPASVPLRNRPQPLALIEKHVFGPPKDQIVAIVGGEGCGKSWVFAQSALASSRPFTLIIPAGAMSEVAAYGEVEPFLINRLLQQTGDDGGNFSRKRWQQRFQRWKADNERNAPKLVVFVDGLNQNPTFDWSRWLDAAAGALEKLGGVLVVSARNNFYRERIETALASPKQPIRLSEWTQAELSETLATKGIDPLKINPSVFKTLQNPRILAIACELFDKSEILSFEELSEERLLLEHIRASARDGTGNEVPSHFIRRLSEHAQAILDRVKAQQREDRLIFGISEGGGRQFQLSADLLAVTAERFFHPVANDQTLYTLSDDGLDLALGLSVIKALQGAERNGKDVSEALGQILDPIAALDKTAEAVFAGLLAASVDDQCSPEIKQALMCGYLRLQNIDAANYPAFAALARNSPDMAMQALLDLSASPRDTSNKNWLLEALREQRTRADCWEAMKPHLDRWLRFYSLAPELGVFSRWSGEGKEKIAEEKDKQKAKIAERLKALSAPEAKFLETKLIRRDELDPAGITESAFVLLAGMPLAEFSEALVAWSFSHALNTNHLAPYDEFQHLVRFNRRDWKETRNRLLESAVPFRLEDASRAGKWAYVAILRATSTPDDAKTEIKIVEELTADREKYKGWRQVEKYCAADPCDPASVPTEEIAATEVRYRKVGVETVARSRWMGETEHFLRDALPGLARFRPEAAIDVQRALTGEFALRPPAEFGYGLTDLEPNTALLTGETARRMMERAAEFSAPLVRDSTESKRAWLASQYTLLVALPHFDGNEQLEALMALPPHGPPLLKLIEVMKPADTERLERAFDRVIQSGEDNNQVMVLTFARYSGTALTERARQSVLALTESAKSSVRAQAFNVAAHSRHVDLLAEIAQSGWNANDLDPKENYFEIWHGSEALITAASAGLLSPDELLECISPRLFSAAARALGDAVQPGIASRINISIARVLEIEFSIRPPAVEQDAEQPTPSLPPLFSLSDVQEKLGAAEFFKRMSESSEDFAARQKEAWESFHRFEETLTRERARLIVEDVGFRAVDVLVKAAPDAAERWAQDFLRLPGPKLMRVQNFALMLAEKISGIKPALAKKLFEHLAGGRAFVALTVGRAGLPLEQVCVWKSAENDEMDALRAQRLDSAWNDHEIALEVVAALLYSKSAFLQRYAEERCRQNEPAVVARGLMICGFADECAWADDLLTRHASTEGLIGTAARAARYAYDRNVWSRHWFKLMAQTASADEFWRFSILFLKVVDPRFDLWEPDIERSGEAIGRFEPSIQNRLENRIKAWKTKRQKTLVGAKVPDEVYVTIG